MSIESRRRVLRLLSAVSICVAVASVPAKGADAPAWAGEMKKVHQKFKGQKGTFALFGDSITVSMAFWAGLAHDRKNLSPEGQKAFELVKAYMRPECWGDWRGPEFGNDGGQTILWANQNVEAWLKKLNPEVALIMFGTNDLGGVPLDEYEKATRAVVRKCLDNGTVVILSTIPPRSGMAEKAAQFADAVRRVAKDLKVPLLDYHKEILTRRPDDWDGTMEKFKAEAGQNVYDAPTLISADGVHPSAPRKYAGDYSDEGLRSNGYGLRSYLTLLAYADVIKHVLQPQKQ